MSSDRAATIRPLSSGDAVTALCPRPRQRSSGLAGYWSRESGAYSQGSRARSNTVCSALKRPPAGRAPGKADVLAGSGRYDRTASGRPPLAAAERVRGTRLKTPVRRSAISTGRTPQGASSKTELCSVLASKAVKPGSVSHREISNRAPVRTGASPPETLAASPLGQADLFAAGSRITKYDRIARAVDVLSASPSRGACPPERPVRPAAFGRRLDKDKLALRLDPVACIIETRQSRLFAAALKRSHSPEGDFHSSSVASLTSVTSKNRCLSAYPKQAASLTVGGSHPDGGSLHILEISDHQSDPRLGKLRSLCQVDKKLATS